jgi:hypothetical protein
MRSARSLVLLANAAAAVALAAGCAARSPATAGTVVSASPQEIRHGQVQGPHVPAGTPVTLRLVTPIGTDASRVGDDFTAEVAEDVLLPDGTVAIAKAAQVRGVVTRIEREGAPALELEFTAVRTAWGERGIEARIEKAETLLLAERSGREDRAQTVHPPAQATFPTGTGDTIEPRYLERQEIYSAEPARRLHLPSGAVIRLLLTRPIAP